jgi:dynein heavy chain
MADTLFSLTHRAYHIFYNTIEEFIPTEVVVKSVSEVSNTFKTVKKSVSGKIIKQKPLFLVDLTKDLEEIPGFMYSIKPERFVQTILDIFDKTLLDLGKIPDLEPKILIDSDRIDAFIRSPAKPEKEPDDIPTGKDKYRKIVDPNKWLWDLYEKLKTILNHAIEPLKNYLEVFQPYRGVLKLNPEEFIKELEQEDPPRSEESLRDEIFKYQNEENKLKAAIPKDIHVSCFLINNQEIINKLAGNYKQMRKNLEDLIARRARTKTYNLLSEFIDIEKRIRSLPKNIEELTELNEFLNALPGKLEKMNEEIKSSMEIYDILDIFGHKFPPEDISRKWDVYRSPNDISSLIGDRKTSLKRERENFHV